MENIIANRIKYSAGLLNDFIFDWNANTRVLYIPVEWKKLIGYEDEEIENSISGIMQIVDESYQESSICNLEKLIKGEIIISKCTKKIICKDGSRKWFSVASKVVEWNTDGSPSRIIAVYTNITEKKIAEQAYEMEHRINEAMLNACKDDFFFIDREMHIISANDTFLATMKANFKKDICFGEGLFDLEFASETLKQKWLDVCTKALAGETISFNHHFYNPPTQIERWSENTLNPVWVNNEVVGVAIRSRDISRTEIQEDSAGLLSNIARNHANELQLRLFESVIKNTQDGIIITEAEPINLPGPQIVYVNEAFLKHSGYTQEEVIGKTPRILQGEKTDRKQLDKLRKALESWQPCEIELINYKKNGEEFWVNLSITPVANEKGWYTHWVSIQKDITASKKAEQELIKSQRFYKLISELNDKLLNAKNEVELYSEICEVFVKTGGFLFVWIGIPSERSNSIRPIVWEGKGSDFLEEIRKISFLDIAEGRGPGGNALREGRYFYSNDIANDPAMQTWCHQALKRGFRASISLPLKTRGNISALLNIYAAEPFFFNSEEINLLERLSENIGFALTAFYINDQKTAAEIQLKKVSQAVEQTSTTVIITDSNGLVEYVNPAFTQATGYSLDEMAGQTQKLIQSGETPDELYTQLWNNLTAGRKWSGEIKNKRKNGQVFWEYVVISPIVNEQGVITNYVSVKEDITQRKKAEYKLIESNQQLQLKTEELSNSNIELERFAFVASHDLQEPLRMITNFLQLFEKKYQDVVDETGKKYIHFAVDGAIRMKELIRDLLQYSRAGSGSLEITEVDMNAIMKDVLLLFRNELYQTNVSVTITDLPVIKAGRTSMIHLMQNLISNAIKFKGVKDPYIVVSGEETPAEWIINVKDNGIGIDPEFTEKIFIVFQRLHRKEEYEGTGIGLSICKKIVERYKGKIWVESKLGQGACFKFSIPKN